MTIKTYVYKDTVRVQLEKIPGIEPMVNHAAVRAGEGPGHYAPLALLDMNADQAQELARLLMNAAYRARKEPELAPPLDPERWG
jgi:hypothetical protein